MPTMNVTGLNLHYEVHNPRDLGGPPVVLVHGLGSCGDDWPFQLSALTPRYPVVTLDLPGHGSSDPARRWPRMADYARAVAQVVQRLGEPQAHLVGLSLGGMTCLQTALDFPDQVRSLTIVNAFAHLYLPGFGLGRGLIRLVLLFAAPMTWTGRWVAQSLFPREEQALLREAALARIAANRRRAYRGALYAVSRFDARPCLHSISCPTLIVAGDRDDTVPLAAKQEMAAGIRGARLEIVSGSGHATPLDAPQVFNRLLLEFLESV